MSSSIPRALIDQMPYQLFLNDLLLQLFLKNDGLCYFHHIIHLTCISYSNRFTHELLLDFSSLAFAQLVITYRASS